LDLHLLSQFLRDFRFELALNLQGILFYCNLSIGFAFAEWLHLVHDGGSTLLADDRRYLFVFQVLLFVLLYLHCAERWLFLFKVLDHINLGQDNFGKVAILKLLVGVLFLVDGLDSLLRVLEHGEVLSEALVSFELSLLHLLDHLDLPHPHLLLLQMHLSCLLLFSSEGPLLLPDQFALSPLFLLLSPHRNSVADVVRTLTQVGVKGLDEFRLLCQVKVG
jgi:hypothetical protein